MGLVIARPCAVYQENGNGCDMMVLFQDPCCRVDWYYERWPNQRLLRAIELYLKLLLQFPIVYSV